jgi:hypothetical protein
MVTKNLRKFVFSKINKTGVVMAFDLFEFNRMVMFYPFLGGITIESYDKFIVLQLNTLITITVIYIYQYLS